MTISDGDIINRDANDGLSTIFTNEYDASTIDDLSDGGGGGVSGGVGVDGLTRRLQDNNYNSTMFNFASQQAKFYGRDEELRKLVDMYINLIGKREEVEDDDEGECDERQPDQKNKSPQHQQQHQQEHIKRNPNTSKQQTVRLHPDSTMTGCGSPSTGPSEFVFIGGDPGIGKTKLVQHFIRTIQSYIDGDNNNQEIHHEAQQDGDENSKCRSNDGIPSLPLTVLSGEDHRLQSPNRSNVNNETVITKPFYYLRGKYEELQRADPLSALVDAFTGFIHTLISEHSQEMNEAFTSESQLQLQYRQHRIGKQKQFGGFVDQTERDRMKKTIRDAIGNDKENQRLLIDLLPDLKVLFRGEGKDEQDFDISTRTEITNATESSVSWLPGEGAVAATTRATEGTPSSSPTATEDSLNRFKYIFQLFVKAVCTKERPIILFLDDLQWADTLSLELLQNLLVDKELKHLMFIGAYRSNEVYPDKNGSDDDNKNTATVMIDHPFKAWMQSIEERSALVTEHIQLKNHSELTVRRFISDLLNLPLKDVSGLTRFIYRKTNGNLFFVMQVLQELRRQNMITYSKTTNEWEWQEGGRRPSRRSLMASSGDLGSGVDDKVTFGGVTISDNVVDTIVKKLQSLPPELQTVLSVAAFMRSSFDVETLYSFLNQYSVVGSKISGDIDISTITTTSIGGSTGTKGDYKARTTTFFRDQKELMRLLDIAVIEGLLENNIGSMKYKFSHDKIQEAAYSLVEKEEQDKMRLQIGKYFVARALAGKGADWMLFVAADHLNSISLHHDLEPLDVAKLNMSVGLKSVKIAAFLSASQYFLKGIEALQRIESPWQKQYNVTYTMYKSSAEVQLVLGSYDLSVAHSQEVLTSAKTLEEKYPAYLAMECSLSRQQRHAAAMKLNIEVVEMLGAYPRMFQKLHLLKGLFTVKKLFRRYSDDEILQFRMMQGATDLAAMDFLTRLSIRAVLCDENDVFALTVLRQVILTFQKGLSAAGAHAVSLYGMILCGNLLELETGQRMAKLARKIQQRCKERHYEAKLCVMSGYFVESWGCPVPKVLELFRAGFKAGMETGDVEFACWNSIASNWTAYNAGYSLDTVLKEGNTLLKHFAQYNVAAGARMTYVMIAHYRLLMGSKKIDWDIIKAIRRNVSDEDFPVMTYELLSKISLSYYLRRYDIAETVLTSYEHKKRGSADFAYVNLSMVLFFKGLIACALGRETKKSKYKSIARRALKRMKYLVERGALNDNHKAYILDAEFVSSFGSRTKAKIQQDFGVAIAIASNAGVLQDTALAYELAGEFFMRINDKNKAAVHLKAACDLYRKWGANVKVQSLLENRRKYIRKAAKPEDSGGSLEFPTVAFSQWS